jgi:hypothetical protein
LFFNCPRPAGAFVPAEGISSFPEALPFFEGILLPAIALFTKVMKNRTPKYATGAHRTNTNTILS